MNLQNYFNISLLMYAQVNQLRCTLISCTLIKCILLGFILFGYIAQPYYWAKLKFMFLSLSSLRFYHYLHHLHHLHEHLLVHSMALVRKYQLSLNTDLISWADHWFTFCFSPLPFFFFFFFFFFPIINTAIFIPACFSLLNWISMLY